jgi:UDP-3-O-[3-hydroxymyristoyl] glucosamine N-acyltransferase
MVTLGVLTRTLGGELLGNPDTEITGLASLAQATEHQLSFLNNPRYTAELAKTQAACVIVSATHVEQAARRGACIVVDDPYAHFAAVTRWWRREFGPAQPTGIHPSAVVDPSAEVHPSASIGPLCVLEAGSKVGPETRLASRVTLGFGCSIGARCIVHSGVVIGADGFGFARSGGRWEKIEQLGHVRIGDDVEIGANTCIDRGALGDTVVSDGVKLDNLIQIGHNVQIGVHTAMAGCVGVAGSAKIGAHCTVGGGAVILGHLELVDGVHISAASVVTRSLLKPGQYTGVFPIDENKNWEKNAASLRQLNALRERIKQLENLHKENKPQA